MDGWMRIRIFLPVISLWLLIHLLCAPCRAQDAQPQTMKLEEAVESALGNYPAIRAANAKKRSAEAGVELARTVYLPRTDLLWQENLATRNNVFGLLLPQSVIPPISGPALNSTSLTGVWGSAGGMLFSWEPFDFGLRQANVNLARAVSNQASAGEAMTRLDVSAAAAGTFLTVLAAEQTVRAAQANVERTEVFAKSVQALVDNQLRPGVDMSRAEADLAVARNQLIQAQQTAEIARADLAESLGRAGESITIDPGPLLDLPPPLPPPEINFSLHPLALAQTAAIEVGRARERAIDRSYFPRFNFQTAIFGRGSGALLDGRFDHGRGFYPDTMNWATGITVTFPVFDIFSLRARRKADASNVMAEQANYDQVINTLKAEDSRARVLVESARKIAANTPTQLKAAQETLARAKARYEYGLTNIIEVADAQRLLVQAEIDDAVGRLAVWRALLIAAKLQGDLRPFLERVANTPVKRR